MKPKNAVYVKLCQEIFKIEFLKHKLGDKR